MPKKLLTGLAPLLGVAVFAVMPAAASAITTYGTCAPGTRSANCPTGEKFTPFAKRVEIKVVSFSTAGTVFTLENEAKTADIECKGLSNRGHVENVVGVGKSLLKVILVECTGSGELTACEINAPSTAIAGNVSGEVITATTVKVKIVNGFNVKCGATELGNVTGEATGTEAGASNVVTFTKATGLKVAGVGATITGSDELYTEEGLKPVFGGARAPKKEAAVVHRRPETCKCRKNHKCLGESCQDKKMQV